MSDQPYIVEFYRDGERDCWEYFESPMPFQAFHVGDVIQHALWTGSQNPVTALRVTAVHHVLWKHHADGRVRHKVIVFVSEFRQGEVS